MAMQAKKRKLVVDVSISSSKIEQQEQALIHEIRVANVLGMVSCRDDLKSEIIRVISADPDFLNHRFTLRILKNKEFEFVSGFISFLST